MSGSLQSSGPIRGGPTSTAATFAMREARPPLTMETRSVSNGAVGVLGLWRWHRSSHRDRGGVLLCMATAVVHLYSTSLYFGGEILEVDRTPSPGSRRDDRGCDNHRGREFDEERNEDARPGGEVDP